MTETYVTTAFSLGMLGAVKRASIDVEEVCLCEVKSAVQCGAAVRIGHQSTADVLGTLLGMELTADRTPVQIQPGSTAVIYVVQLLQRPQEGQVYTRDEVRDLVRKGLLKAYKVTVRADPV